MVHNGIEYADIQLNHRGLRPDAHVAGLSVKEIAVTFEEWNEGDLESFLIEINRQMSSPRQDPQGDGPLIDKIVDQAEQKGNRPLDRRGRARAGRAADRDHRGVFARALSSLKDERAAASKVLAGPEPARPRIAGSSSTTSRPPYASRSSPTRRASSQMAAASKANDWTSTLARWRRSARAVACRRGAPAILGLGGLRPGEDLRGGGALVFQRRQRAGEDGLGDRGQRHALLERVLGGPAAGAFLLGLVDDLVDQRAVALRVLLGEDFGGDSRSEAFESPSFHSRRYRDLLEGEPGDVAHQVVGLVISWMSAYSMPLWTIFT